MLEEFAQLSGGTLNLEIVNPEPFSEAEDRAVELGVQAVPLAGGETLYFGLAATNAVGETGAIPYFSPARQQSLEYDLSKLIFEMSRTEKPVVGLLSTLDVAGGFNIQTGQSTPAWAILEQLRRFFEVERLDTDITRVPDKLDLLMLVHPAELTPATRYAIDQFVLRGGRALVFVDPIAMTTQTATNAADPQSRTPDASDLEKLLAAWGVRLRPGEVVIDAQYAMQMASSLGEPPTYHYAVLTLPPKALNQSDVITRGLQSINMAFSGVLEQVNGANTTFMPLASSSDDSMLMSVFQAKAADSPRALQRGFEATGKTYSLAARIRGPATTAFPDGPPAGADQSEDDAHLVKSIKPINVVVVADTDLLTDRLWVQVESFFGQQIATPWADNGEFAINAVDNLLGSSALIGIRSRESYSRPFEVVDDLRREAEQRFRAKEEELQARLEQTERKLNELQSQQGAGDGLILSPEQRQAIERFQQDKLDIREELRAVRHELNKDIEALGTTLKLINIALVPLLFISGVIAFKLLRRGDASAKAICSGGSA